MSTELFFAAGSICFSLAIVGFAMTMQEFRIAEMAKRRC
jgi:hypothetical protein